MGIHQGVGERMDDDVKKAIEEMNSRLREVEKFIAKSKDTGHRKEGKAEDAGDYGGLKGGINSIIKDGFINTPRSRDEIHTELARLGYHYSRAAMQTALNRDFMKKKRLITRIKEGKIYKYVVKK